MTETISEGEYGGGTKGGTYEREDQFKEGVNYFLFRGQWRVIAETFALSSGEIDSMKQRLLTG